MFSDLLPITDVPRREFRFSVHTGRAYAFDADGGLLLNARRLLAV
jgi:hypothetical protein